MDSDSMTNEPVKLTEFMYANVVKGSLMHLYVLTRDGHLKQHLRFTSDPIDPEDNDRIIPARVAAIVEMLARSKGEETKVTDSGDMLLFHSMNGAILYPKDTIGGAFWSSV